LANERELIYDLFKKYLEFLGEKKYYDSNLIAYEYLPKVSRDYDFVVVDEVQDITNVQLYSIIKALKIPTNFILCGDSNQIVHPNFFSWANIKTLFYKQDLKGNLIRVLSTNYRNTPEVTNIANQLLLIKNARFGSIDKESNYLVKSNSQHKGEVQFLENLPKIKQELNQKTKKSAKFAVIVMRNEDKAEARKYFQTPLLFSIHEVKGLEYENIILFNIISDYEKEFRELTLGVNKADLQIESLTYARAKDKTDKSLDEFKFYINALYVAMTRAIKNLYVVETNKKHALLELLELTNFSSQINLKEQNSSAEEWQREANRLEKQGKTEQAEAIRKEVLQLKPVPWEVITHDKLKEAEAKAFDPELFNKKAKDVIYEYALFYGNDQLMKKLSSLKYRPADDGRWQKERAGIINRKFQPYIKDDLKAVEPLLQKHGLDFRNEINLTPFMMAVMHGALKIIDYLLKNGVKTNLSDNYGKNAMQMCFLNAHITHKREALNRVYPLLKNESLRLKIKNKFIKLDNQQAEYFMLHFMLSILSNFIREPQKKDKSQWSYLHYMPTFETSVFLDFYQGLGHHTLPEYRSKRSYLSSILGKNEVRSTNPYSKKLWVRIMNGHYIINPLLEIMVNEEWINVYDWVNFGEIEAQLSKKTHSRNADWKQTTKENVYREVIKYRELLKKDNAILPDGDGEPEGVEDNKAKKKK
jgi:ankyrin repeat protein